MNSMNSMSGADLIVKCLENSGVQYIFGIPGAKIDALFNVLLESSIQVILCRHEQNAAFMAACYGRLTGKPGVVLVTSGPGVSNLLTGLLTATTEGDPVVALGGNVSRKLLLKEAHQANDNVKLLEGATKYCVEVSHPENLAEILENGFRQAMLPKAGAAFISLPQDILTAEVSCVPYPNLLIPHYGTADKNNITRAIELINKAKNPVLLLGLEASRPENTKALRALLDKVKIPVVETYQGAGVTSRALLDLFVGRVGLFKNQPGDLLLEASDLVITVGFYPVEYDPDVWNLGKKRALIHIGYTPAAIHTDYFPSVELLGDIATTLYSLEKKLEVSLPELFYKKVKSLQQELIQKIENGKNEKGEKVHPLRFIYELRRAMNDETIVISDIGSHYLWIARYLFCFEPHHLLFSNGQQTMGVALPWGIAAKMIFPNKSVISISGDGGFLMSAMELETAVRFNIPIVHFVWCDCTFNMVQEQQEMKYRRKSSVDFGYVDIVQYAQAFGAEGIKVTHSDELPEVFKRVLNPKKPTLIEIPIDYRDNRLLFAEQCKTNKGVD